MTRLLLTAASLLAMFAVLLGAFGAHALRGKLEQTLLHSYETGVQYQLFHAIALLVIGLLANNFPDNRLLSTSGIIMLVGTLLFSGSLYILALSDLRHIGPIPFGLVTPLGGSLLIVAWLILALGCLKIV